MTIIKMTDLDLRGQRVLMREDLNVPIKNGIVSSDARLRAALPSIKMALQLGAKLMVTSHLGRPNEGEYDEQLSLAPVVDYLAAKLQCRVRLQKHWLDGVDIADGELVILENCRFNPGEKANNDSLSKKMAALCDVYVNDAFGTAHRAQASTHGIAKFVKTACAGLLLVAELEALGKALDKPKRPLVAIVGGSKVSTKLTVLETLSDKVDQLIVGGGIANTFLAAAGLPVGKSLYEPNLVANAKALMEKTSIPLPTDLVTAKEFSETAKASTKNAADVAPDDIIMDVGPETAHQLASILEHAGTIIWNGPLGVFEFYQFGGGTQVLAHAIAASSAFSIAGGGDTLAAVDQYGITDQVSYISTGGGAFLEFVEGKELPAVAILHQRGT